MAFKLDKIENLKTLTCLVYGALNGKLKAKNVIEHLYTYLQKKRDTLSISTMQANASCIYMLAFLTYCNIINDIKRLPLYKFRRNVNLIFISLYPDKERIPVSLYLPEKKLFPVILFLDKLVYETRKSLFSLLLHTKHVRNYALKTYKHVVNDENDLHLFEKGLKGDYKILESLILRLFSEKLKNVNACNLKYFEKIVDGEGL